MTIAGILVTDTDSIDAAADILDSLDTNEITCPECDGRTSITDYSPDAGWINIECPRCEGVGTILDIDPDGDDDWEPPTPAAPAVAACRECSGSGTRRYSVGFGLSDWIEEACTWCVGTGSQPVPAPICPACDGAGVCARYPASRCWYCDGSGADGFAAVPLAVPAPFDRAAHCRRIAASGGAATVAKYGRWHMATIGTAGARVTIARHGLDYWRGLVTSKGWTASRTPDLLSDLAAGRELAAIERIAA